MCYWNQEGMGLHIQRLQCRGNLKDWTEWCKFCGVLSEWWWGSNKEGGKRRWWKGWSIKIVTGLSFAQCNTAWSIPMVQFSAGPAYSISLSSRRIFWWTSMRAKLFDVPELSEPNRARPFTMAKDHGTGRASQLGFFINFSWTIPRPASFLTFPIWNRTAVCEKTGTCISMPILKLLLHLNFSRRLMLDACGWDMHLKIYTQFQPHSYWLEVK